MDYQTNKEGHGKRPLWHWILLCIIIGAVVYGFVYYVLLRKSGGGSYTEPAQNQASQQYPAGTNSPAAAPQASARKSFTVHANDTRSDVTTITVKKGDSVQITFNVDANGTYHGGLDFRSSVVSTGPVSPGDSKTVTFTAADSFFFTPYWPSTNIQKPYKISVAVQ